MKVAVFGASGYSGVEIVRSLARHPQVELTALGGGENSTGKKLRDLYPALSAQLGERILEKLDPSGMKGKADFAFLAVPHVQAMAVAAPLVASGIKVVDLSADFRIKDTKVYESFYKHAHTETQLLAEAVYGQPELHAAEIRKARLVANPGCYATTSILALYPLLHGFSVRPQSIVVDAKSGVSGKGRKLSEDAQFIEIYDNFSAYSVGGVHRHIGEIEQELSLAGRGQVSMSFTPHLLPISRGILATCYAELEKAAGEEELLAYYRDFYKEAPYVRVYKAGELPQLRSVHGTNDCHIGLKVDRRNGRVIVIACTDNLGKGAAFQAVQNMNLMAGFGETLGLEFSALTT